MANRRGNPHACISRNEIDAIIGTHMQEMLARVQEAHGVSSAQTHALLAAHMQRITELHGTLNQTVGSHENRLNRHDREIQQLQAAVLESRRELMDRLNIIAGNHGNMGQNPGQIGPGFNRPRNHRALLRNGQDLGNPHPGYLPPSPPDSNDGRRTGRTGNRATCGYCLKNLSKGYISQHIKYRCLALRQQQG